MLNVLACILATFAFLKNHLKNKAFYDWKCTLYLTIINIAPFYDVQVYYF